MTLACEMKEEYALFRLLFLCFLESKELIHDVKGWPFFCQKYSAMAGASIFVQDVHQSGQS
jgi:hypothetical protein